MAIANPTHQRLSWILDRVQGNASDKAICMALSEVEDKNGDCIITYQELARRSGVSLMTVSRAITRLEEAGVLTFVPGESHRPNTYRFVS